jgi:hypothetical protein
MDPYFQEFAPILNPAGGVNLYQKSFALDYFIPAQGLMGNLTAHEREYLNALIDLAHQRDKRPVLTFNRSLGRIAALRKEFGGYHIATTRNLFEQWVSALSFVDKGDTYFLSVVREIIRRNSSKDRFLSLLRESAFHSDCSDPEVLTNYGARYAEFLCFHLYFYMFARKSSDLVIDVGRLASDSDYRLDVENKISQQSTAIVDLSSAEDYVSLSRSVTSLESVDFEAIHQFLEIGARCLEDQCGLGCEDVLEEARFRLQEAIDSQRRYDKYCRAAHRIIMKAERKAEREEARAQLAEARAQLAEAGAERLVAMLMKSHLRPWRPLTHYIQYVAAMSSARITSPLSPRQAGRLLRYASKRNPRRFRKLIGE